MNVRIDWMLRKHMPEVLTIENASFPSPWLEQDFILCLRQRNHIGMVAIAIDVDARDSPVLGYMIYEFTKSRIHLLNLAVAPEHRRQGVGTAMVEKLKSKLSVHRRVRLTLEVREGNLPAQLFLRSQGFRALKIFHDFYPGYPAEDAYFMSYHVKQPQSTHAI